MKIYLDSCDPEQIKKYSKLGIIDGVTTNPSIIAKHGKNFNETITQICNIIDTSVSIEVTSSDFNSMITESKKLLNIAPQITIKLPITEDGLNACRVLRKQHFKVNMTLCFSPLQALLAAKVGATYVSPFLGRLDDIGSDGTVLIDNICRIFQSYPNISTQIIAASVRSPIHMLKVAQFGVDVVTVAPELIKKIIDNPLTSHGIEIFSDDWKKNPLPFVEA